jgi:hypothetical protein
VTTAFAVHVIVPFRRSEPLIFLPNVRFVLQPAPPHPPSTLLRSSCNIMGRAYSASLSSQLPSGRILLPMACFISMAMLCTLELCVLVCSKFRRRSGLYFWSIVAAIFATALYEWSNLVQYFLIPGEHLWVLSILGSLGYVLYILSEFLVLYSRLHLVQASPRTLRIVRSVIIAEFLLVTVPDTILANGALYLEGWAFPGSVFRRTEIVIYCTVEIFFSLVYIYHVRRVWNAESSPSVRRVWNHLLYTNVLIIILEISNVAIEFSAYYALQNCYTVRIPIQTLPNYSRLTHPL